MLSRQLFTEHLFLLVQLFACDQTHSITSSKYLISFISSERAAPIVRRKSLLCPTKQFNIDICQNRICTQLHTRHHVQYSPELITVRQMQNHVAPRLHPSLQMCERTVMQLKQRPQKAGGQFLKHRRHLDEDSMYLTGLP